MIAVLAHGFGLGPDTLASLAALLKRQGMRAWPVDLGFFGLTDVRLPKEPFVAIGHSYGLSWLLRQAGQLELDQSALLGVISLCGFTRFTSADDFAAGLPPSQVRRMRRDMAKDTRAELKNFWDFIGLPQDERPPADEADAARLLEALDDLASVDVRQKLAGLDCPKLILGGAADALISKEHLSAGWPAGVRVQMHPHGGHMLPLTHAGWCAREVARFRPELLA